MKKFQIYAPLEARTKNSILILWDKINEGSQKLSYEIFVNGKGCKTVNCTDDTLTELAPDTEYSVYNITDFGACCGERVVNTGAIQKAIDSCTAGGTVYVPAGEFYTGALYLHSNMTLELAEVQSLLVLETLLTFSRFSILMRGAGRCASLPC